MQIECSPLAIYAINNLTMRISGSGYVVTDDHWRSSNVCSPYSRLYLVTAGSGELETNGVVIPMTAGHAYLVPAGLLYLAGLGMAAAFWGWLLGRLGQRPGGLLCCGPADEGLLEAGHADASQEVSMGPRGASCEQPAASAMIASACAERKSESSRRVAVRWLGSAGGSVGVV